jgi:aspartyl-tRNA(Asn)/glutamyl-tRNA(Gln) amidotransferase subunit C
VAISREDVLHVAALARLTLTEAEVGRATEQLSGILEHVAALSDLDLEGVEPTAHALDLQNVTRPDQVRPSWPLEEVLSNAPEAEQGAFRVPPA